MMHTMTDPFRLDQGDVSFDAPDTVKQAMARAIVDNRSHYLPTTGLPRLRQLLAEKLRARNGVPVEGDDEVVATNGGTHGVWAACHALLEAGDEVIVPDPEWPPTMAIIQSARAVPVAVPLRESRGWRWNLDEVERAVTPKTRALYVNSPNNPSGGVLPRADLERLAAIARDRNLWVLSDEAYEHVIFKGEHVSIASLPGMYERTIPLYTFSKSYAMTGLRLGYVAIKDQTIRDRAKKILFYTTTNVASVVQFGGIGALEGPQE
jgi:aspartate aminotransferase